LEEEAQTAILAEATYEWLFRTQFWEQPLPK
jgi:hypothetical protein